MRKARDVAVEKNAIRSKDKTLTINVEYNVIDSLLKTTPIGGDINGPDGFSPYPGNINTLLMHIPTYSAELARTKGIMPEFVNPKYTDSTKTKFKSPTRLECMMQDFPRLLDKNQKVGFSRFAREACFTCVKNNIKDAVAKAASRHESA